MKKIISLLLAVIMTATIFPPSYTQAVEFSNYTKHHESTFVEDGKTYKVEEDLTLIGDKIKTVSCFLTIEGELLETQITTVDRSAGVIYFENRNSNKELINSKSYEFDEIVKPIGSDEDTHNVFVTYSSDRGKFLRHVEYTINLFGEKATALVVGSILAGVLVIAPEPGISLGAKLLTGASSAGLLASSGNMPWNVRASVDVYSSPYRTGKHYTRYYGDFYTTDSEYITSLH
ncbi:MAG: hypothetical protein ACTHWZ_07155 [Peptoniphilaceae bacterium]